MYYGNANRRALYQLFNVDQAKLWLAGMEREPPFTFRDFLASVIERD